ncbi:MAG TPA: FHA domain-containing protein, partial [Pirellulales bacterium]|nr:FHA domain-containing protein [Pirellulales bacterium]
MADLIAQGADAEHRWRRTLLVGRAVTIGRAPNAWPTSWDDRVSRQHAEVTWDGQRLRVRQLAGARNPIFIKGRPAAEFDITPGEHFV